MLLLLIWIFCDKESLEMQKFEKKKPQTYYYYYYYYNIHIFISQYEYHTEEGNINNFKFKSLIIIDS